MGTIKSKMGTLKSKWVQILSTKEKQNRQEKKEQILSRPTAYHRYVCRLRIIKTRTERVRPGTEANFHCYCWLKMLTQPNSRSACAVAVNVRAALTHAHVYL